MPAAVVPTGAGLSSEATAIDEEHLDAIPDDELPPGANRCSGWALASVIALVLHSQHHHHHQQQRICTQATLASTEGVLFTWQPCSLTIA